MKKKEFISIAAISCLVLTCTARAEQPFDDGAFPPQEQQIAAADSAPQQQALVNIEQAPQQQVLANANTEQAPQQQTIAITNSEPAHQQLALADPDDTQTSQQQTLASAEPIQASQAQKLSRKELVAIANASDPEKQQTADEITAVLKGKNPESLNINTSQAENNIEPEKNNAVDINALKTAAAKAINVDSPADLSGIKHFIIRSDGQYAYNLDCFIKAKDVLCKGSLKKQPANFKSYESTLLGQISGSVIKGSVTSYTKIAGSSAGKECDTDNETNWPMTITLNADHEAMMDTGPVKSIISTTGSANCSGTSEQSYPGKKISMKWRAIG